MRAAQRLAYEGALALARVRRSPGGDNYHALGKSTDRLLYYMNVCEGGGGALIFEFFPVLSPEPSIPLEIKIVNIFCPNSQPFLRETCFSIIFCMVEQVFLKSGPVIPKKTQKS